MLSGESLAQYKPTGVSAIPLRISISNSEFIEKTLVLAQQNW